jgi:hypothetical protein
MFCHLHLIELFFDFVQLTDMLAELSRREKAENIKPDPDLDIYMKVMLDANKPHCIKLIAWRYS